jgi:hypothetical protein
VGCPVCRHLGKPIYFLHSVSVEFLRHAKVMLQSGQGFVRPILVSDRNVDRPRAMSGVIACRRSHG